MLEPSWYISILIIVIRVITLTIFVEILIGPLYLLLLGLLLGEKIVLAGQIGRYY